MPHFCRRGRTPKEETSTQTEYWARAPHWQRGGFIAPPPDPTGRATERTQPRDSVPRRRVNFRPFSHRLLFSALRGRVGKALIRCDLQVRHFDSPFHPLLSCPLARQRTENGVDKGNGSGEWVKEMDSALSTARYVSVAVMEQEQQVEISICSLLLHLDRFRSPYGAFLKELTNLRLDC
jgi:hypothetical protein